MNLHCWKFIENKKIEEKPLYENVLLEETQEGNEIDIDPWFLENINSEKCEYLLTYYKECRRSGTFLIRRSQSNSNTHPFTLCIL